MDGLQTIPGADDEAAWNALADWLGQTPFERLAHGLRVQTAEGWKTAFAGDHLYRDRSGQVTVMFAGALERAHAPPAERESWELTIAVHHAHGDVSRSISVILGLPDGRIDAGALANEVESFVGASSRPADISVSLELRSRTPRGQKPIVPNLDELKARAGETIGGTL